MALDYKSSLSRYRKYLTAVQHQPLWQASLILILSLGLLIILLLFVLRPTLITISSLLGQIETQQDIDRQLDTKIAALQQAQQVLTTLSPKLIYLDQSLPTSAALGPWTQAVETIASASGVTLTDVSLSEVPLTEPASESGKLSTLIKIPFQISATAGYSQLVDFIDTLEKLPRLAILSSVQITRQNDGQLSLLVEGTINFTYTSPPPPPPVEE